MGEPSGAWVEEPGSSSLLLAESNQHQGYRICALAGLAQRLKAKISSVFNNRAAAIDNQITDFIVIQELDSGH